MYALLALIAVLSVPSWGAETVLSSGELPFRTEIPEGWTGDAADLDRPQIFLERRQPPAFANLQWLPHFQPILTPSSASFLLERAPQMPGVELGEVDIEMSTHERLGTLLIARTTGTSGALEIQLRSTFFSVASGVGFLRIAARTQEQCDADFATLAEALTLTRPPVSSEALSFGAYGSEAGFSLALPDGFRPLTAQESTSLGWRRTSGLPPTAPTTEIFVDPKDLSGHRSFLCATTPGALEVIDESEDPRYLAAYQDRIQSYFREGNYSIAGHISALSNEARAMRQPIHISPSERGEIRVIDLEDRSAYLWRVPAMRGGFDGTVLAFYTSWDNTSLDCLTFSEESDAPILDLIEPAMTSIRVTDGSQHPMRLSVRAQYLQLWPWTHPLLQVWWIVSALCAMILALGLWILRA